jgi:hypothetical protein
MAATAGILRLTFDLWTASDADATADFGVNRRNLAVAAEVSESPS